VGELLARAGVCADYAALGEEARVALLRAELASPRLLFSPFVAAPPPSARLLSELGVVRAIAAAHAEFGSSAAVPHYIISNCSSLSVLLEAAVLLKEGGVVRLEAAAAAAPSAAPTLVSDVDIVPLFETIPDLEASAAVMRDALSCAAFKPLVDSRGGVAEVMLGYSDSCELRRGRASRAKRATRPCISPRHRSLFARFFPCVPSRSHARPVNSPHCR
jgi:phosphoenolpyruvate carboxylase